MNHANRPHGAVTIIEEKTYGKGRKKIEWIWLKGRKWVRREEWQRKKIRYGNKWRQLGKGRRKIMIRGSWVAVEEWSECVNGTTWHLLPYLLSQSQLLVGRSEEEHVFTASTPQTLQQVLVTFKQLTVLQDTPYLILYTHTHTHTRNIVKLPNVDHIGDKTLGLFSEVGPFSEVIL